MSGIKHAQEESQGFHVDVGNKTHRQEESEGFHVDDGNKTRRQEESQRIHADVRNEESIRSLGKAYIVS